jgi:predicted CoA-binding protein
MDTSQILRAVRSVLVIDWPSKDVPESLVRAGLRVVVKGCPGPEDYFVWELVEGKISDRRIGRLPEGAELVYSFRPLSELPDIIAVANSLHAKTIWYQSGLSADAVKDPRGCWLPEDQKTSAVRLTQSAGVQLITQPYIADAIRALGHSQGQPQPRS